MRFEDIKYDTERYVWASNSSYLYWAVRAATAGRPDSQVPPLITLNDLLAVKKDVFCQKKDISPKSHYLRFAWLSVLLTPLLPPWKTEFIQIFIFITKTKSKCRRREISFSMFQISMLAPHPGR